MTRTPDTPKRIFGFCWFRREDYVTARGVMSDPHVLYDTFDEWLASARHVESEVTAKGDKVVRIRFDLPSFLLYCAAHGRSPDEQSRANWAAQEVRKKYAGR